MFIYDYFGRGILHEENHQLQLNCGFLAWQIPPKHG